MSNEKRDYSHRVPYADLHTLREDERIEIMARAVMSKPGEKIGCAVELVEAGQPKSTRGAKGDRYIRKMKERYPLIRVEYRGGLAEIAPGTELIRFTLSSFLPATLTSSTTPPEAN